MGIRGIPANYGGFETFAEEIAPRLLAKGHEVTVYGRSNNIKYDGKYYKGVRLRIFPTIPHKYLDTVAHTFLCTIHSLFVGYDVILICNSANAIFSWIPRLRGQKVIVNVDGLEWKRKKWNKLGQWFYKISEWLSTFLPNAIVTDAVEIKKYYLDNFKEDSTYIPYGAPVERIETTEILEKFGLESRKYILYVSRLEPENNAHLVVKAFEKVKTEMNLVVVGDAPYNKEYIDQLKSSKDRRIVFTGYVFGDGYKELQSNAYIYIQATEVGGTHPALVEGMGFGNCVLANDVVEHHEVLGDTGVFFTADEEAKDLAEKIQFLCDHHEEVKKFRQKAQQRAREKYSWDGVAGDYEKLFIGLLS